MKKENSGFSLTEILVAIGLSGLVLLGVTSAYKLMIDSQTSSMKFSEENMLTSDVQRILSDWQICTNAITGATSAENQEIQLAPNLKAGQPYNDKLNITAVKLTKVAVVAGTSNQVYSSLVEVDSTATAKSSGMNQFVSKTPLMYKLGPTGKIANCMTLAPDPITSCLNAQGTWDAPNNRCNFCQELGGTFAGGKCSLPIPTPTPCTYTTITIATANLGDKTMGSCTPACQTFSDGGRPYGIIRNLNIPNITKVRFSTSGYTVAYSVDIKQNGSVTKVWLNPGCDKSRPAAGYVSEWQATNDPSHPISDALIWARGYGQLTIEGEQASGCSPPVPSTNPPGGVQKCEGGPAAPSSGWDPPSF